MHKVWPRKKSRKWSTVNSPHKGQWRGALIFLSAPWINGWVSNGEAGDLRHHRAHYDVIVMIGPVYWSLGDWWPLCRTISPTTKWSDGLLVLQIRAMMLYSSSVLQPIGSMCRWFYESEMMTSSNGKSFHVTGYLCGEFIGHRSILHTKTSDPNLWCFLRSAPQ